MKKKQLNRRQLWRIQKMQNEYAARANREQNRLEGEFKAPDENFDALGPQCKGLVLSHFGQQLDIEALEGEDQGQVFRCFQRSNLEPLVTGDEVIWQPGNPLGVVVATLPRSSVLKRPTGMGELKPVAANIDHIIIVIAPKPEPHYSLIDRYLVAAEEIKLTPIVLLNKSDLIDDSCAEKLHDMLSLYRKVGYQTLEVSSKALTGMPELKNLLVDKTSIFVGQSGVGKSALVNALLPEVNTLEGALSTGREMGRHTTTSARLFHFPEGGDLIDSPGIREFGLGHIEDHALIEGFIEFREFLGACKFRDCKHDSEPGCLLLEAVENEHIDVRRLNSYRQILQSKEE